MKKIVVLISGSGSNLQAILDACEQGTIADSQVVAVISNKETAYGLERARQAGVDAISVSASDFDGRESFDQALADKIDHYDPDLVILAGYMRILSPNFVRRYLGRMLNIHPSLLPKYPGLHTHQRALDAGDKEHGTSVHFVTEELDGGPVILQAKVPIFDNDDVDEIQARVQQQEHKIYPLVADWFLRGRLEMENGLAILDSLVLPIQGYASDE
ncbi:phosphoribosylglycinamide formyltransferase [Thaumasiovibrio sp. DFM-14]|uniref:phosphoribosylglycinamide formyltransferase n=1 Tax=Thaumasiovibrio sp. DFM-14 TaxID=3384792 RepID=UPI0039A3CA4C